MFTLQQLLRRAPVTYTKLFLNWFSGLLNSGPFNYKSLEGCFAIKRLFCAARIVLFENEELLMSDNGLSGKEVINSSQHDWPDLAGRLAGESHILPVRVYYEDTDFSGLVYHATYIRWCERGRTDFVRLIGLNQKDLFEGAEGETGLFFVVRHMEIDYLKPAMMDDVLEVVTKVAEQGTASLKLFQEIRRGGAVLFKALVTIVLINERGRRVRLTEAMKKAFISSEA